MTNILNMKRIGQGTGKRGKFQVWFIRDPAGDGTRIEVVYGREVLRADIKRDVLKKLLGG